MLFRSFLAICATLVCLGGSSVLRADQNDFAFKAGRAAQKSEPGLRQEIHIFLNSERRAVSSLEVETSPFNAILKLRSSYPDTARVAECTAFAIDRSIIITAAHCIHGGCRSAEAIYIYRTRTKRGNRKPFAF